MERRPHFFFFFFCRLIHGRRRAPLIVPYVTSVLGCIYQGALAACDSQSPALYRGREGRQHNDLISMLGTPRAHRPWCAAAPWDPRVYALLTALSMQHCAPTRTRPPSTCTPSSLSPTLSHTHSHAHTMQRFIQALLRLVRAQGDQGYQWPSSGMQPACVRGAGDVSALWS